MIISSAPTEVSDIDRSELINQSLKGWIFKYSKQNVSKLHNNFLVYCRNCKVVLYPVVELTFWSWNDRKCITPCFKRFKWKLPCSRSRTGSWSQTQNTFSSRCIFGWYSAHFSSERKSSPRDIIINFSQVVSLSRSEVEIKIQVMLHNLFFFLFFHNRKEQKARRCWISCTNIWSWWKKIILDYNMSRTEPLRLQITIPMPWWDFDFKRIEKHWAEKCK